MVEFIDCAIFQRVVGILDGRYLSYLIVLVDGEVQASSCTIPVDSIQELTDEIRSGMIFFLWTELNSQLPNHSEEIKTLFKGKYGVTLC